MSISPISNTVARRYILGRQGLWPGRRWAGKDGTIQALRYIECVQMDPLNVIARSHDLALWGRVLDYRPEHLDHRIGFERVYDFRENITSPPVDRAATLKDAERFFARKAFAFRGLCTAKSWANWTSFFVERKIGRTEAQRWLSRMMTTGEITSVTVEGGKDPYYLLADEAALLATVNDGSVPKAWRPLNTTTQEEVLFLAPLETVSAHGRAKRLFGFDYLWEVYKPAAKRRWGYYTLPILYGDELVARLDMACDRESETLVINGFWLEDERTAKDANFAEALARGLTRLAKFVHTRYVDASAIKPPVLRKRIQAHVKEFIRPR